MGFKMDLSPQSRFPEVLVMVSISVFVLKVVVQRAGFKLQQAYGTNGF